VVILTGPHSGTTISSACAGLRHPGRLSISPGEHATSHLNPGMQATEVTVTAEGGGTTIQTIIYLRTGQKLYSSSTQGINA